MIVSPLGLVVVQINIEFNQILYEKLEIDLDHINKNERSNLSLQEVLKIFDYFIRNLSLQPSGEKSYKDEICSYYVRTHFWCHKKYRLIFCICSDRPLTIGVLTLFRVRK